ncbi:3D domain-containing protein [Sporolituus thermophilus]|uniref:3D (Asp-Asp-Asp) domain-containing protein n=1 Tax=Sporolituus thermophilus DSM 23256 TaxID=1123285 RepID=A0A1G7HLA8_9FIRM|nr:3D domain-containing protein [Sporolituus thermophilus]SDF01225.1 3D (Asp-Asp-Asp) domain-containing protein [Sporolituus thermophilus DSM 23256]
MSDDQSVWPNRLRSLLAGRRKTALLAALLAISLLVTGFVWAQKKVHVVADGRTIAIRTLHSTIEEVLAQAGVYLGPKDEYRLSTPGLQDGTVIEVYRAVPVTVVYQGKTDIVVTGKPTVGEVLDALGIPRDQVKVAPDRDVRPTAGMTIKVATVTEKLVQQEIELPYPVVRQPDAKLEKGDEAIVADGEVGLKVATVKLRYEDGELAGSETLSEKVVREPKPRIIHVGTRDTVETSRGTLRFKRVQWMEATAYNPTDGAPHGLTATGIPARHGIVAVDPDVIPLGTRVYIPNYGLALAADVGGAIVGNRIDLCMEGYQEAWNFGRRMVKVYILD